MNTLSIFLYLIDVFHNLSFFFALTGIMGTLMFSGVLVISLDRTCDLVYHKGRWLPILGSLFLIFLALLIPDKSTMYMIAGSEAGEYVVHTEQGKEMINDIHEVIKHQLNKLKSD